MAVLSGEPEELDDKAKKIQFKNLIKEKVLRPSKLREFSGIRGHHSHLVIRDSHYLIKLPTSFITCAACHRGRVLKISSIQESSTQDILNGVYNSIGKNPCSKRKQTTKETQEEFSKTYTNISKKPKFDHTITPQAGITNNNDQIYSPLQPNTYFSTAHSLSSNDSGNGTSSNGNQIQLNPINNQHNQGGPVNMQNKLALPHSSSSNVSNLSHNVSGYPSSLPISQSSLHLSSSSVLKRFPTVDDYLDDFDELPDYSSIEERVDVKSIGSAVKISGYTLTSLFNGLSTFPGSLDLFMSLSIESNITPKFFTPDTLIVPLPAYSSTIFMKDFNKNHFISDEILGAAINKRINEFIEQPNISLQDLKIVIILNYFQEGTERPNENQSHKYVGNIYVLNRFSVLQDSSLTFSNARYTFNHNYTWVDSKEEWLKIELFNELVIKPLQSALFSKYQQALLGNHLNGTVYERGSTLNLIPYTVDESFLVTSASSLYVINFISLKLLRVLCGIDGLQMISYLLSVKVNSRHNLHLLKLLLERIKEMSHTHSGSNILVDNNSNNP